MSDVKSILFAEDNPLIVLAYRNALMRAGYHVKVAEDGLEAAKIMAAAKPDLVVLDLMMPKFSGTDLIKYIRASPVLKSIPVIILSEVSIADLAQEAISIGAERVFLKSRCTPATLIGAIKQLLHDGELDVSGKPPAA